MRFLEITYPNGDLAYIAPVSRARITALELLLRQLSDRWVKSKLDTAELLNDYGSWQLMNRIAAFFPRIDLPGTMGFDIDALRDDPDQLESLFLAQTEEGQGPLQVARLIDLSCFEPIEIPLWRLDTEDEPIPSSGDPDMDLMAMLTASTTAQDAAFVMDTLSTEQLDRFLFYLAELRRDPGERRQEFLDSDYQNWKEENQDIVNDVLGIKFNFPVPEKKPDGQVND
jgi:hypothetical protein